MAILIPTSGRPESLRATLESLATAPRDGIQLHRVVVVSNPTGETDVAVCRDLASRLPLQHLVEPQAGKCQALNRGLAECGPAELIAILDDDITVDRGWFAGVHQITTRWPDKGYYGGSLRIIWPTAAVPAWAFRMPTWAFSALPTAADRVFEPGYWASPNCFWFRARLLPAGYQFPEGWVGESSLMLDLADRGFGGVIGPEATAGHNVQPALLDLDQQRRRAQLAGRSFAEMRLVPYRAKVKHARLFHRHPVVARVCCALKLTRWWAAYWLANCSMAPVRRIVRKLHALERMSTYRHYLRICQLVPEYQLHFPPWGRRA